MFVAMNRFKIAPGKEAEFIEIWRNRETHLDQVPGFKTFNLLQGLNGISYDHKCRLDSLKSIGYALCACHTLS